jgi:hypothetical protein
MRCKFCREIIAEGFGGHILKNVIELKCNQFMLKKLNLSLIPSWTGGVPRPIVEVNRGRRGGGIKL